MTFLILSHLVEDLTKTTEEITSNTSPFRQYTGRRKPFTKPITMFRGISVATDPVQQGNLTENPSLIITAVYGCYHEGKMSCSYTHFLIK